MRYPLMLACVLLTGCAGLNVAWVFQASYNTPATTSATMTTGAQPPAKAASAAK
jgi:hypothetical protein